MSPPIDRECLHPFKRALALIVAAFLGSSCASREYNYRNEPGTTWQNAASIQRRGTIVNHQPTKYDLAFIEFGEEGSNYDLSQLPFAKSLIAARKNPLVFLFVHGWHHNSAPDDNDVRRFNNVLTLLAGQIPNREVVGVYLGWPGETLHYLRGLNSLLTYYTRKSAAERLANNYGCINAIGTLLEEAHRGGGHSILVGHSFGGLVVERAIKSSLANPSPGGENVILRDTLVVLMNPATESVLTREIMEGMVSLVKYDARKRSYVLRNNSEHFAQANEPLVTSITSTNDHATGLLFPISSWLWTAFHPTRGHQLVQAPPSESELAGNKVRKFPEQEYFRHTPGNEPHLHNMTAERVGDLPQGKTPAVLENLRASYPPGERTFLTSAKPQKQDEGASVDTWNSAEVRTKWAIKRAKGPDQQPKNADIPYWIIRVEPEIINEHGGIWNDNSIAMVAALYRMKFPTTVGGREAGPSAAPSMKSQNVPASYLGPVMRSR